MHAIALAVPLVALTPLTGAAAKTGTAPAATPDGRPRQCLQMMQVRETRVRSDRVIDFVTAGGKVYRNTLDAPCPELGFERRFSHETGLDQYCATDTITVLIAAGGLQPGATCGLGAFQPVTLVNH